MAILNFQGDYKWSANAVYDETQAKTQAEVNAEAAAEVSDLKSAKAPVIIDTASGAIASFEDGADGMPIKALTVNVEPQQDLHGYENPWPAGGGKNKCATYRVGQDKASYVSVLFADIDNFAPDTTYTISFVGKNGNRIYFNESIFTTRTVLTLNGTRQSVTLTTLSTLPSKESYGWIIAKNDIAQPEPNVFDNLMIETGSTAHNYEPYSNICPISGWTSANVTRTGKNLLDVNQFGETSATNVTVNGKGSITFRPKSSSWYNTTQYKIRAKPNTLVTLSAKCGSAGGRIEFGGAVISMPNANQKYSGTAMSNSNGEIVVVFRITYDSGAGLTYSEMQIEEGSSATDYEEFGTTIPIIFPTPDPGTVYGGSIDWIAKKLKSRPYYASYNGESLVGPWISSMDAYVPGTTPTIGAQVVDLGSAETIYDLAAVPEIVTLYGTNNIWADCGPVSVDYPADSKLYIDDKIAAAIAAAMNA